MGWREGSRHGALKGPLHWGLMLVCVPKSRWGRKKGGRKDGGLTQLSLVRPPTGLIILDCLFSTFCCHGDGTKTWLSSDLCTLFADALSPCTCCVSAYWMRLCEGGWLTRWLLWVYGGGGEVSLGNLWEQSYGQPHYPGQAVNSWKCFPGRGLVSSCYTTEDMLCGDAALSTQTQFRNALLRPLGGDILRFINADLVAKNKTGHGNNTFVRGRSDKSVPKGWGLH